MPQEEVIPKKSKDRAFNPFRQPKTKAQESLVDDVTGQLIMYEELLGTRTRKRKAKDEITFRKIITSLLCDLIHNNLTSPERTIYISLSNRILGKKSRYTSPVLSKTLPETLKLLSDSEMNFVVMEKGFRGQTIIPNRRTTITCGARLLSLVQKHKIVIDDFCEDLTQETVVLKNAKEDFFDKGERTEYEDTLLTHEYRSELLEINTWIAQANIQCSENFDTSNRLLIRYFSNNSFESNGRYFGGFWQSMSKIQRRQSLYIDDESIVTLDFSQVAPRIAYSLSGVPYFNTDAYTLPSGRYNRKDIKKVFNAMIYADKSLSRFPRGTKEAFERRVRFADVRNEILDYHNPIKHLFGIGIGLKIMFIESQIIMSALLECKKQGIVALPVHDALIIAELSKDMVKEIMLTSFKLITGIEGKVEEE